MYTIIGGDGSEYGPVTADQIRAWIAAKRASLDTMAKAQGTEDWKRLSEFPEFQPGAPGVPPPISVAISPEASASDIAAQILAQHGRPTIGDAFERSWELLKTAFWPIVGVTTLSIVVTLAALQLIGRVLFPLSFTKAVPTEDLQVSMFSGFLFGNVACSIAFGSLFSGLFIYFLKRLRGETATVKDAFCGFSAMALPLILAAFLQTFLCGIGFMMLIIPGLYLAFAYIYTPILILDKKLGVWTAMEVSRRIITAHWFTIFFTMLTGILLLLLGLFCFGVGVFVAYPITVGAVVSSYEMIVNPRRVTIPTT
jgi:hypothetical protein